MLLLAACSGNAPQQVEVTRLVPQTVEVTRLVLQTVKVTVVATPVPPTNTATALPKPKAAGRLAFVSKMEGEVALYTINADLTGLTRLTHEPMLILNPIWSPDGTQIAFAACLGGDISTDCPEGVSFDIYVVNADGSNQVNLTQQNSTNMYPSWSPDGQIAFMSNRSGKEEIYTIRADGSGLKQLTDSLARNYEPAWSPDGKWLAYHCIQDLTTSICIQPSDGTAPVTTIAGTSPVWSSVPAEDGLRLAYHCWSGNQSDICIVFPDGSGLVNLTQNSADDFDPTWSPDGLWIAFRSNRSNWLSIYKVCVACEESVIPIRLTDEDTSANRPAWSPDDRSIAFLMDLTNLYLMDADGNGKVLLAEKVYSVAVWQPSTGE